MQCAPLAVSSTPTFPSQPYSCVLFLCAWCAVCSLAAISLPPIVALLPSTDVWCIPSSLCGLSTMPLNHASSLSTLNRVLCGVTSRIHDKHPQAGRTGDELLSCDQQAQVAAFWAHSREVWVGSVGRVFGRLLLMHHPTSAPPSATCSQTLPTLPTLP